MDEDFQRLWALALRVPGAPTLALLLGVPFTTIQSWVTDWYNNGTRLPQMAANYIRTLSTKTTDGLRGLINKLGDPHARSQVVSPHIAPPASLRHRPPAPPANPTGGTPPSTPSPKRGTKKTKPTP